MRITLGGKFLFLILIVLLFVTDCATKYYIGKYGGNIPVFPFLTLSAKWNKGVSFGFLSGVECVYCIKLTVFVIIFFLFGLFFYSKSVSEVIGLTLIISGALGNFIDRVMYGAVYDFISFCFFGYCFPTFNFADTYITIGACFFLFNILTEKRIKNT